MEITLSENSWTLSGLTEGSFALLRAVPPSADPGECVAAHERLFPPPMQNPSPGDAEFIEEWGDYVTDDLITRFGEDIAVFSEDLDRAVVVGKDEEGNPIRSLEIPRSHAAQWFSALNQARLVLAEVYQIYDEDGRISPREDEDFAEFHRRWSIYMQSNLYAMIQEWLVSEVLQSL